MNKSTVIVGAGAHAKMLVELLEEYSFTVVGLTDNDPSKKGDKICGYEVLGDDDILGSLKKDGVECAVVGLGSTRAGACFARKKIYGQLVDLHFTIPSLIHPSAIVSERALIGKSAQFLAGSIVQAGSNIMENVLLNAGAVVEHDCILSAHSALGSGAILCGSVTVCECAHVGAGASVRQGLTVGKGATVGMGAAVIRSVGEMTTVAGVPAHEIQGVHGL